MNEAEKEVVIVSEVVPNNIVPEAKGVHRVNEYWSIMVLKANDSFQKVI